MSTTLNVNPDQAPHDTPAEGSPKKPWWKRWWGITLLVFGALMVIGALTSPEEPATEQTATEEPASNSQDEPAAGEPKDQAPAQEEPAQAPADEQEAAEPEPAAVEPEPAADEAGFGSGTYAVGSEVQPGTYRSTGENMCYWARLSGFSGELDDIITNGNSGLEIVTIAAGDAGFETQGCGDWVPVERTAPAAPATEFTDGTYQVGVHVEPGTYKASGGEEFCYWARLSDFSHTIDGIVTNGNNMTTIEIAPSDAGFTTSMCGSWTKIN